MQGEREGEEREEEERASESLNEERRLERRGEDVALFASEVVCLCLRRTHPPPMVILQVSKLHQT